MAVSTPTSTRRPSAAGTIRKRGDHMTLRQLDITPVELLTTTRTVRKRLDFSRPVDRSIVEECLRLAWQAPNGSNQQMYGWVCVDDPDTRAAMADVYRNGLKVHQEISAATPSPYKVNDRQELISSSV